MTSRSNLPSKRYSRVADAVQIAPYLTHVVKHHGQITLIPPENTARIRKPKKKRPPLRAANSTVSLELPRTPPSCSRPQTPRPQSSNSVRIQRTTANGSGGCIQGSNQRSQEYLCIPDFPPPSFEEAVLSVPSPQSTSSNARVSNAPTPASAMAHLTIQEPAASSPETESLHSESSHSSLEEAGDRVCRSLWEQDIEAGYGLEERVQRELERRRLAESLPHAPVLRLPEQKNASNDGRSQTNIDDILLAIQRKYREHRLRLEVAAQDDIALASPSAQEPSVITEPVASTSAEVQQVLVLDSGISESEVPTCHAARRKGKEKAVLDLEDRDKIDPLASGDDAVEGPLSKIREVFNVPLRPQPGPSGSVIEISSPEFTIPCMTIGRSVSAFQSVGAFSHTASTSHSATTSSSTKDASTRTSTSAESFSSTSDQPDHAPVSPPAVSSASLSSAEVSSSVPPASGPNRPLPAPPITPPTTPSISSFTSRRPLPSVPLGRPSVRDRISAFESLQSRPIPPPPPLPKSVRRPPPVPAPSSFDRARRFLDDRTGNGCSSRGDLSTCAATRGESGDAMTSPFRRRPPPPVPTRRTLDGSGVSQPSGSSGIHVDAANTTGSASTNDVETPLIEAHQADVPPVHEQTASFVDLPSSLQEDLIESRAHIEPTSLETAEEPEEGPDAVNPFEGGSLTDTNRAGDAPANPQVASGMAESVPSDELHHHLSNLNGNVVRGDESHAHAQTDQEAATPAPTSEVTAGRPNATIEVRPHDGDEPTSTQDLDPVLAESQGPSRMTALQSLQPVSTGLTDLDLLLARLDDPDFTFNGRSYEDLLLLEEIMGPAFGSPTTNRTQFEDIPLGRVEVLRRRVTRDGRTKLKLALLGVVVDKCGICLAQFKDGAFSCLLPCRHAFHEKCLRLWMRRGNTCPLCRGPLLE